MIEQCEESEEPEQDDAATEREWRKIAISRGGVFAMRSAEESSSTREGRGRIETATKRRRIACEMAGRLFAEVRGS